ncbi:hypothetical protein BGZ57DRAFT_904093 [Hyaloscypha finlandica]|nr:hypothetical protein BGZ57DRAFT_904093 [Hyaloscypha finlandica]
MWDPLQDWPPDEDRNLYDILSPVSEEQEQLWTTWQYQAAYPNTADFLAKATSKPPRIQPIPKDVLTSVKKSRSRVSYYSFLQTGEEPVVEKWSSEDPVAEEPGMQVPMPQRLWNIVQRRVVADRTGNSGRVGERLPSRLLCIEDISPVVAAILLASTPKSVVSSVSPFLERYLGFTNFGKASMQSIKSEVRAPLKALGTPTYIQMSHKSSYIPKSLTQG